MANKKAITNLVALEFENSLWQKGHAYISGVDEVGMGCLAGPVVAAAVIFHFERIPKGIRDSKLLPAKERERLDAEIRTSAVDFAIGLASVDEIDTINILQAARLAMKRAVGLLRVVPTFLLIDGRFPVDIPIAQEALVKGDSRSVSIGGASIIAKVFRDKLMRELDDQCPGYGFANHKGYGSIEHRKALQEKGASAHHRKSFSWTPV